MELLSPGDEYMLSSPLPVIHFCHWERDGIGHRPWAGFAVVSNTIQTSAARGHIPPPMLIFGFHSRETLPSDAAKVLDWKGVQYLRYDVDDGDLILAVQECLAAVDTRNPTPVPTHLKRVPVADILRRTSGVRHWMMNRLRNTRGFLENVKGAARGDWSLHDSHLSPVDAVSAEHQATLDRLWALDARTIELAPTTKGMASVRATIAEFEARWRELEVTKATLCASCHSGATDATSEQNDLYEVARAIERVNDCLVAAILHMEQLEEELKKKQDGDRSDC